MSDFEKATDYVRRMPASAGTTNELKLQFYGLFKQAQVGDNSESQPWAVQIEARAKWQAWKAVAGKSKEDAQSAYIALLDQIEPNWRNL